MMKNIVKIVVLICLLFSFVGCNKISERRIVGTWTIVTWQEAEEPGEWEVEYELVGKKMIFTQDGIVNIDGSSATWCYVEATETLFIDGLGFHVDQYKDKTLILSYRCDNYNEWEIYAIKLCLKKENESQVTILDAIGFEKLVNQIF